MFICRDIVRLQDNLPTDRTGRLYSRVVFYPILAMYDGVYLSTMARVMLESRYNKQKVQKEQTVGNEAGMIRIKVKCYDLWRVLVKRGGKCEICGHTQHLHSHHPFGRHCGPTITFNPLLGICLCGFPRPVNCHDRFPQGNIDGLLAELLPRILTEQPERVALLEKTRRTYKRPSHEKVDYKAIYAELQRFEREHADSWMDEGCESEFGRTF